MGSTYARQYSGTRGVCISHFQKIVTVFMHRVLQPALILHCRPHVRSFLLMSTLSDLSCGKSGSWAALEWEDCLQQRQRRAAAPGGPDRVGNSDLESSVTISSHNSHA